MTLYVETVKRYQAFAISKAASYDDSVFQNQLWVLALGGELGEIANLVKKWLGHGHHLNEEKLVDELGDGFWYSAVLCEVLGLKFADMVMNRSNVVLPSLPSQKSFASLALGLALQGSQGIMASMVSYASEKNSLADVLYSPLSRVVAILCALCSVHGFEIEDVLGANMVKLEGRYPGGFSVEKSVNREG